MQHIRTQPDGPKAFRLYSTVRDDYRHAIGERAFTVYAALTYYVDPKTLTGAIPVKLLAQTTHYSTTTVRRALHRMWQQGLITITPQWDAFGCVPQANLYTLHVRPGMLPSPQPAPASGPRPLAGKPQAARLALVRFPTGASHHRGYGPADVATASCGVGPLLRENPGAL